MATATYRSSRSKFVVFITNNYEYMSYESLLETLEEVGEMLKSINYLKERRYTIYLRDVEEEDHFRNGTELFISTPSAWFKTEIGLVVKQCKDLILEVEEQQGSWI